MQQYVLKRWGKEIVEQIIKKSVDVRAKERLYCEAEKVGICFDR
jgi:hypothetical protein